VYDCRGGRRLHGIIRATVRTLAPSRCLLLCTVLASLWFLAFGIRLAYRASATSDEVPHIGAGVMYLRGDLRLNREHPPLTKVLAALALPDRDPPLTLSNKAMPIEVQWGFGSAFLHRAKQAPLFLLGRARTPLVVLNALLLPCLAILTCVMYGPLAAAFAVLLAALCPLWLAHASLVTTDAAASLFCFAATGCAAGLSRSDRKHRALLACGLALCFALALASKYSMLALPPLIALGVAIDAIRRRSWAPLAWALGGLALGGALGVCFAWGWPARPELYWQGVHSVGANHRTDYAYYAFGELFYGHDPLYFGRALLVKAALPVWIAMGCALLRPGQVLQPTAAGPSRFAWPLAVVPVGYYVLMAFNAPAFGVRYVLPLLPFMFVAAGVGAARLVAWRWGKSLLMLLMAAQLAGYVVAWRATPLAFFNGFFCFTGDALPCLDDSNLDWGQALPELARYRERHYAGVPLRVLYYGSSPVEAYVPNAVAADLAEMITPRPALYAVSLHYRVRSSVEDWTRRLQPLAIVAGVYAIFDLRGLAVP
jgi:hypothetical protein